MKKTLLLLTAFLASATMMNAGGLIKFGVHGGIVSEEFNINTDSHIQSIDPLASLLNKSNQGYMAGAMLRVKIPVIPIYIQPEINYVWNEFKNDNLKIKTSNVEVPVLVGVTFGHIVKLRVNAGPVYNLESKTKVTGDYEIGDLLDRPEFTWTAGAGVDLFKFTLDFRYNGQFKDEKKSYNFNNIDTSTNNWSLSLGYMF